MTASRKQTQTMLVARRSLAWRLFSTTVVATYEMARKNSAAIMPHCTLLCQPAARPRPTASAIDTAAKPTGARRGSERLLRPDFGAGPVGGVGRSCTAVAWLMRWPPSTPCGGR